VAVPIDGGGGNFLSEISSWLAEAQRNITEFGKKLEAIPVIGAGPAYICYSIAWWFYKASVSVSDFKPKYDSLVRFAQSILDRWGLDELIGQIWGSWNQIKNQSTWWVKERLEWIIPRATEFLTDPARWVVNRLADAGYAVGDLFSDVRTWLRSKLLLYFPELVRFSDDPLLYIKNKIYDNLPGTRRMFDDPKGWMRERLGEILGLPLGFWYDPWHYLLQFVLDALEARTRNYQDQIYRLAEKLARRFWEGV